MTQTVVIMGCNEPKRSCDEMRSDKMRKDLIFKRHGIRVASQELVAAKHRRLGRHLQAQSLLRSIGYKCFKFETSAPGLPRYYLYLNHLKKACLQP